MLKNWYKSIKIPNYYQVLLHQNKSILNKSLKALADSHEQLMFFIKRIKDCINYINNKNIIVKI